MKKRIVALVLALGVVLTLGSCGSKPESTTPIPAALPAESVPASPTEPDNIPAVEEAAAELPVAPAAPPADEVAPIAPVPAPAAVEEPAATGTLNGFIADGGPVFIRNYVKDTNGLGARSFSLYQLDLNTLKFNEIFSCPSLQNSTMQTDVGLGYNNSIHTRELHEFFWYTEQAFSPDFSKVAIQWYGQNDASGHVGWIDKTGQITDVTIELSGGLSDFEKRPNHTTPVFAPSGEFIFYDKGAGLTKVIDPISLTVQETISPTGQYNIYVIDRTNSAANELVEKNMDERSGWPATITEGLEVGTLVQRNFYEFDDYAGSSYLLRSNEHQIWKSGVNGESITITPETDFHIFKSVYKDGKILFTAVRGSEYVLFEMDDAGGVSSPRKIMDLPSDQVSPGIYSYRLLCWK